MKKYRTKPWAKGLACGLFVLAMTVSVICLGNVRWLAYHGGYQWEGTRQLVEEEEAVWVVRFTVPQSSCLLDPVPGDHSGLDFLRGKDLRFVNEQARRGTVLAHVAGCVPNLLLTVQERTPYWAGQLVYFFEYACGLSGYLLGVNPFNQPGVEAYKTNMFALLGKPGFAARREDLLSKGPS